MSGQYEITRSINHQCPAIKVPGDLDKLASTSRIIVLKGATDAEAQMVCDALNRRTQTAPGATQPSAEPVAWYCRHSDGTVRLEKSLDDYQKAMGVWRPLVDQSPAGSTEAEPVAWFTEDHLADKSATTYNREVAERWKAKGWPVTPLYLHPSPADEAVRRDALNEAIAAIEKLWHDSPDCRRQCDYNEAWDIAINTLAAIAQRGESGNRRAQQPEVAHV